MNPLTKLSKLKFSNHFERPFFYSVPKQYGFGAVVEKTNFNYVKEILGFSIRDICDIQNLHEVCLFIATKNDRIFSKMIKFPSVRNLFLIEEILKNEIYPYIDESVYLEETDIYHNIRLKLERWLMAIIIENYTLNEKDISSGININFFVVSFKKNFLLNEICWDSIILKFINEHIYTIVDYIKGINKNKRQEIYIEHMAEDFLLFFLGRKFCHLDIELLPKRIIIHYFRIEKIYNVLMEIIKNKNLVMTIMNITSFHMPDNDVGWDSDESNY
jgi:hypothetical protein